MKIYLNFLAALSFFTCSLHAQVGIGTTSPNASALIDLTSTSKGLLLPRMTRTEMLAITNPASSLLIICTDCNPNGIWILDVTWKPLIPLVPAAVNNSVTCSGALAGNYFVGQPLNSSNTKTVLVSPTTAGQLTTSTNYNNGVAFSQSRLFLTTGANQSTQMVGDGIPSSPGIFNYTVTSGGGSCTFNVTFTSTTSGGTAVVSSYDCTGANVGALLSGVSSTGVTHTITANVTSVGTYNISTNAVNGVTYSASGTFSGTGAQPVVLAANGTPTSYGNNTWTLNGTPTCSFDVFTYDGSSGGNAVVSAYDCSGADAGTLTVGVTPSGVTHVITATVTTAGTYNISAVKNGITFSASGTFPGSGSFPITLTATGTPTNAWSQIFTLNVNPSCSFSRIVSPAGTFDCVAGSGAYTPSGPYLSGNTTYSGTFTLPYTAGNGTSYGAISVVGGFGYGLTLTRVPGTYAAGGGNVTYNLSGTTPQFLGYQLSEFSLPEGCNTSVLESFVLPYSGTGASGLLNGAWNVAHFTLPYTIVLDPYGYAYVGDTYNHVIRKVSPAGDVTTLAGSGVEGFADGTGAAAQFDHPTGLCLDATGNLYVADSDNNRIRKVTPAGVVTTIAGSGTAGSANGTGTGAQFHTPWDIVIDGSGNFYIADRNNHKIRKMTSAFVVTNFAGSGVAGFANGTGASAQFNNPTGMAIDASGNIYLADASNNRIRKITSGAVVTTFAGQTAAGSADGTGTAAQFNGPVDVALDGSGNLIIADKANHKIRRITPATVVTTIAGSTEGFSTDIYSSAQLNDPQGVAVDSYGRILVADTDNNRIRVITN